MIMLRRRMAHKGLTAVQRRGFIETFGLKTILTQAEIDSRVDPETKAYRYYVKESIPFDPTGRLVLFDAVPHALKHRLRTPIRSTLISASLYLAFLGATGTLQAQGQAVYSMLAISGFFALGIFSKSMKHSFKVSRVFLLKSGKEIRVENCTGLFTDVPIEHVTLAIAD